MVIYSKVQLVLDFDTLYPGNALSMFCYYNDYHGNVYNNNILPICQVDKTLGNFLGVDFSFLYKYKKKTININFVKLKKLIRQGKR